MKLLGPKFSEQSPEQFWHYAKDVHKFQNIKRPEAKTKIKKTRKKQTPNGKHDTNSRSVASNQTIGNSQEDAINI